MSSWSIYVRTNRKRQRTAQTCGLSETRTSWTVTRCCLELHQKWRIQHRADIDFLCAVPSTSGAGAVILLVQVSRFIRFFVQFKNIPGEEVVEPHYVFASMPVMVKIPGPRI